MTTLKTLTVNALGLESFNNDRHYVNRMDRFTAGPKSLRSKSSSSSGRKPLKGLGLGEEAVPLPRIFLDFSSKNGAFWRVLSGFINTNNRLGVGPRLNHESRHW